MTGISFEDWDEEFGDTLLREDDEGRTTRELADHFNIDRRTMNDRLIKRLADGRCVVGKAHRVDSTGRSRLVPVYRLVEKKR